MGEALRGAYFEGEINRFLRRNGMVRVIDGDSLQLMAALIWDMWISISSI